MHIMHTVFIILSHDTCIFFCSSPLKIFHNIFYVEIILKDSLLKDALKYSFKSLLVKGVKGPVKSAR